VPIELDYIRFRWVGDLERMRDILKFNPTHSAEETLRQFADQRRTKSYVPETISRTYDVDRMRKLIERRHRGEVQIDGEKGIEDKDHE
jgi:hypothetical protein